MENPPPTPGLVVTGAHADGRLQTHVRSWAAPVLVVAGIAAVFAVSVYLRPMSRPVALRDVVLWQVLTWLPWLGIAPGLVYLSQRLRWSRRRLLARLTVLLVTSFAVALGHTLWFVMISTSYSPFLGAPATRWGVFRYFFIFWFHLDLLLCWALIALAYGSQFYERAAESERRSAQLELDRLSSQLHALKLQMRPHFFFNVLNTIVVMLRGREYEKAEVTTLALSDLFRHILAADKSVALPLKDELTLMDRYIDVQSHRFEGGITLSTQVAPSAREALVPSLVLLPLLENAIEHGIARCARRGPIRLSAEIQGARLVIELSNPVPPGNGGGNKRSGHGTGLSNTRMRLRELYGSRHEFRIRRDGVDRIRLTLSIPYSTGPGMHEVAAP